MKQFDADQAAAITDSARHFLAAHAGPARARQHADRVRSDPGHDSLDASAQPADASVATDARALWRGIGELGWFGVAVPEAQGGLGWGAEAACLVAEQAGFALLMPPLTAAMAAAPLLAAASGGSSHTPLQALLRGECVVVLAAAPALPSLPATEIRWSFVPDADLARWIVATRAEGSQFEARLIDRDSPDVALRTQACVDGSGLSELRVDAAAWGRAPLLAHGDEGRATWTAALQLRQLADAACLCGVMAAALAMSLQYLRLREQFGVPIGSFQALQHRAVDCHIAVSSSRALVFEAAQAVGTPQAAFAAAAAIRQASRAALQVTKENIQFHGAVGFADEHDAGLFLRRAMVVAARHTQGANAALRAALCARVGDHPPHQETAP